MGHRASSACARRAPGERWARRAGVLAFSISQPLSRRTQVTCDLGRPTCGACVRYARAHPDNRCVYAENTTQVPARRLSPETTVPAAGALELPRTRSGARRLQAALRETAEAASAPIIPSEVETPPLEVRDEEDADPAAGDLTERMADATLSREH